MTSEDGGATTRTVEFPQSSNLSQPLIQYYTSMTNAILGNAPEARAVKTTHFLTAVSFLRDEGSKLGGI